MVEYGLVLVKSIYDIYDSKTPSHDERHTDLIKPQKSQRAINSIRALG